MARIRSPLAIQCPLSALQARIVVAHLMEVHRNAIAEVFRRFRLQSADADEATQKFFLRASKAATNWISPPDSYKAWCVWLATCVVVESWRQSNSQKRLVNDYANSGMARTEVAADTGEEQEADKVMSAAVETALRRLPRERREVVERKCDGLSFKEIAAERDINATTAGRWFGKAIKQLHTELAPVRDQLLD
jgi:RNA polymerase sigma factor (sigma-70 family)